MLVIGPNSTKFRKVTRHPNNLISEQSGIPTNLTPIREARPEGRPLPPKLKRPTGEYRESKFTRAETYKLKTPWEPVCRGRAIRTGPVKCRRLGMEHSENKELQGTHSRKG